jgi:uncharacterized membrane protein
MNARIDQFWNSVRESYWFVPALMSAGAIVLAVLLIVIDWGFGVEGPERYGWLLSSQPDGARALLSTVAGSMITVAGVSFSVTLVALATATSQYGPRLLSLFLRDRGVQVTMGGFSATFLYCLIVLRVVRSAPPEASSESAAAFVPQLAVLGALVLAVLAVGVFIYFIHHIAQVMHVSNVVARASHQLLDGIDEIARHHKTDAPRLVQDREARLPEAEPERVLSNRSGYVQSLDLDGLIEFARDSGLVISVDTRRGGFVTEEHPIARVWPAASRDDIGARVRDHFAIGNRRTHAQDVLFTVDQIVQIAARALSPGVNDPFTAMTCIDWLESAIQRFSGLPDGEAFGYEESGFLRVVVPAIAFSEMCSAAIDQVIPYASGDVNAALHLMRSIDRLIRRNPSPEIAETLLASAAYLHTSAEKKLIPLQERRRLSSAYKSMAEFAKT